MRLFAALAPDDATRDRLAALQNGLPDGKRVEWENLHITLAFFGDVDERRAEDLHAALGAITAPPLALWLDGVSLFGGDKPRLAYAAVRTDADLHALHAKIVRAARGADVIVEERRYTPHATLMRFRGGRMDRRLRQWLESESAFLAGPLAFEEFRLFRSELGRSGPVYSELASYGLSRA